MFNIILIGIIFITLYMKQFLFEYQRVPKIRAKAKIIFFVLCGIWNALPLELDQVVA